MTTIVKRARLGLPSQSRLRKRHVGVAPEPSQPAVLREKDVLPHQAQPGGGQQQRYEVDGGVDGAVALRPGDEYAESHGHRGLGQPAERRPTRM